MLRVLSIVVLLSGFFANTVNAQVEPPQAKPGFSTAKIEGGKLLLGSGLPKEVTTQTYTVQVPYTETVNGKSVTKFRTLERTREVIVANPDPKRREYPFAEFKYFEVSGKMVILEEARKRLQKASPVLLFSREVDVEPYWEALLKPSTLILMKKQ